MESGQIVAIVAIVILVILILIWIGTLICSASEQGAEAILFTIIIALVLVVALCYLARTSPTYAGYVGWLIIIGFILVILFVAYAVNCVMKNPYQRQKMGLNPLQNLP